MNRVRTACAIVIQSFIRRLLAIKHVKEICKERGLNPNFSSKSADEAGLADVHPSRVQHIAAIIIQINVRDFLTKIYDARSPRMRRVTGNKSVTMLYSGKIPTELHKDDGISESTVTLDDTLDTTFDGSLPSDESLKFDEWEGVVQRKQVKVGSERLPDAKTMARIAARWQSENVTSKELEAIITIQCFVRVICANEKALALLDECFEREEEDAAIVLQCWVRQILARWKLLALRNGIPSTSMTEREAAITLQCFARVLSANKKALVLLDEVLDKEEETAAIVLQRWCRQLLKERGIRVSSPFHKHEEIAIVKIQAVVRQFLAVTDYHKHIDAAIVLQCFARVLVANERACLLLDEQLDQEEEKAAIVLQHWIRKILSLKVERSESLIGDSNANFFVSLMKQRRSFAEKDQRAADECWSSIGSSTTKSVGLVRTIAKGQMGDRDATGAGAGINSQLDAVQSSLFRVVEPEEAVRTKAEVEEAIITLQCFVRVISANAKAAALLDSLLEKEENDAAIVIQCWIRQCRARKSVAFLSRVHASSRVDAVIRIQSIARCYLAQKKYRDGSLAKVTKSKKQKSKKRTLLKNKFEQPEHSKVSVGYKEKAHLEQQEKKEQAIPPQPAKKARKVKKEPWWALFFSCLRPQVME